MKFQTVKGFISQHQHFQFGIEANRQVMQVTQGRKILYAHTSLLLLRGWPLHFVPAGGSVLSSKGDSIAIIDPRDYQHMNRCDQGAPLQKGLQLCNLQKLKKGTSAHNRYLFLHGESQVQQHTPIADLVLWGNVTPLRPVRIPHKWEDSPAINMIAVLSGFSFSLLALIQPIIKVKHCSRVCTAFTADNVRERQSCVSSAYEWQLTPNLWVTCSSGLKQILNSIREIIDPCRTLQCRTHRDETVSPSCNLWTQPDN